MQFRAREAQYAASFPDAESSVVMSGETEVGRLLLSRSSEGLRIVDLALLEAFRGQGIGSAILGQLIESGEVLWLNVRLENPARRLYERLGFQVVSQTETDCEMRPPVPRESLRAKAVALD